MNATIIGIGAIVVTALIYFASVLRSESRDKKHAKEKRIDDFVIIFFSNYKKAGVVIELIIPSGIGNLQNDDEIKNGFDVLKNRLGYHPLRKWDNGIKSIGYKKFFSRIIKKGIILDKTNIENEINEAKQA